MKLIRPGGFTRLGTSVNPISFQGSSSTRADTTTLSTLRRQQHIISLTFLQGGFVRVTHTCPTDMVQPLLIRPTTCLPPPPLSSLGDHQDPRSLIPDALLTVHVDSSRWIYTIQTPSLIAVKVFLENDDFRLEFYHTSLSSPFLKDLPFRAYEVDRSPGGGACHHYITQQSGDLCYGMGEVGSPLTLNGRAIRLECKDAMGYNAERAGPMYKHCPIYYTLNNRTNACFGIFYDSLSAGVMDFGQEIDALWGSFRAYKPAYGDLDYYVWYGPQLSQCVEHFSNLVGKPALVPKYALGYLASSMGYAEDDNASALITSIPEQCRHYDIPCDVLHLSSGYTTHELTGARQVFTWNGKKFPDPVTLFQVLRAAGIRVVANVKPWLLMEHPHYQQVATQSGFILDEFGMPDTPRLWAAGAGSSAQGSYFDFSSEAGLAYWTENVAKLFDVGIEGAWNDNNEFSIGDDDCTYAGKHHINRPTVVSVKQSGRLFQCIWMAKASYDAAILCRPLQRPYIITRSGAPGSHRYACQTWSGDNFTSWETLKHNIPMGLNAGLSLMSGYGHDVGGFAGPRPGPYLFCRWVQNGIFHPRFCIHSWKAEGITEPWMYPEVFDIIRDAIHWRYRFLPYLYSLSLESSLSGAPLIRPLVYEFQQDSNVHCNSFDFMLGPGLLIASVLEDGPETQARAVYLPTGTWWCNFWTGEWQRGGRNVIVPCPLFMHGVVFAKAGTFVPTGRILKSVGASDDRDDIRIVYVFPCPVEGANSTECSSSFLLYDDDGITHYPEGAVRSSVMTLKLDMKCDQTSIALGVQMVQRGILSFKPKYSSIHFLLPVGEYRTLISLENGGTEVLYGQQQSGSSVVPMVVDDEFRKGKENQTEQWTYFRGLRIHLSGV